MDKVTLVLRAFTLHSFKHRRLRACRSAQVDPRIVVKKTLSSIIPWMFFVVIWTYLGAAARRPAFLASARLATASDQLFSSALSLLNDSL